MRYIALEEAFSIPELDDHRPSWSELRFNHRYATDFARRLPDFTEYRLPDMDAATARDRARFANDYLARVVAEHPDRFRGFAALPMQDPRAAAEELGRAVRELGFCGALVNDHFQGHYLDEPQYEEIWAALEELSVPLYLHPGLPPADRWKVLDGRPELAGAMWAWAAEVGGHAMRIVLGGVFDRHPEATLILGHMGEFLPYMRSRLGSRYRILDHDVALQRMPSAYIGSNIVITTSGVFSPAALTGAVLEIGADAVMFSIDYPYESSREAVAGFEQTPLSDADREKIAYGNAKRILRL
jgi:2,3-dihydroxybenzoate decarboxylase